MIRIRESLDNETNNFLQLLRHNLKLLYESSIKCLRSIESNEKVFALKASILSLTKDFLQGIRSHELYMRILELIHNLKCSMYREVSKQAIYFGCGGLLTGAIIGVAVGYSCRIRSLNYTGTSNYLMRAIVAANTKRGIDGITLMVLKTPQILNPDDVIIQVRAVGVDLIDSEMASGYLHKIRHHYGLRKIPEPFVLGRECSGVVIDIGSQVKSLEINDKVWAILPLSSANGFMSEYVVCPEQFVALKPQNVTFEGAATLPYAFITFVDCLEKNGIELRDVKNKRVLIHLGLSSKNDGVGLVATQLLKSYGARVTISTEENVSHEVAQNTFLHSLKTLGAESHLIIPTDHKQVCNLAQRLFDIVINTDSLKVSQLLSNFCKSPQDDVLETFPLELTNCSFFGSIINCLFFEQTQKSPPQQSKLSECKKLVESRHLVPIVSKSFLCSQYDQLFRYVAKSEISQATIGKSVLVFRAFK